MIKYISAIFALLFLTVAPAAAVTLTVGIDSISGDGASADLGFYSTTGADGTFRLQTITVHPEPLLFLSFPGAPFNVNGVTAGGGNAYLYDSSSGVMTVTGALAGITGDFAFPGDRSFSFDIQLASDLSYIGLSDLPAFYSTATAVQGSVTAFFSGDPSGPLSRQTLTFSSPSEVPLPAGAALLLSGLIFLGLKRKAS